MIRQTFNVPKISVEHKTPVQRFYDRSRREEDDLTIDILKQKSTRVSLKDSPKNRSTSLLRKRSPGPGARKRSTSKEIQPTIEIADKTQRRSHSSPASPKSKQLRKRFVEIPQEENFEELFIHRRRGTTVTEKFKTIARTFASNIAIETTSGHMTYKEFDDQSTVVARSLIKEGAKGCVGMLVEDDLTLLPCLLGILKAGCAYVPLDVDEPDESIQKKLEDSGADHVFTSSNHYKRLSSIVNSKVYDISEVLKEKLHEEEELGVDVHPDDLAYLMYTSGSTGVPNGVKIRHRGICELANHNKKLFDIKPEDKVLKFAKTIFDASVWDIFHTILNGATLFVAKHSEKLPGLDLFKLLKDNQISILCMPPSALVTMNEYAKDLKDLRLIVSAAEACVPDLLNNWMFNGAKRRFFNAYGPTECTVCATIYECTEKDLTKPIIPIGKELTYINVHVVDENYKNCPNGISGQIAIESSSAMSPGYHNRDELNKKRFIQRNNSILFLTGDKGYCDKDVNIIFQGRIDNQVKINGFRIELESIESLLNDFEKISFSICVAKEMNKRTVLVCYYKPNDEFDIEEIRDYLKKKISSYAIPSYFIKLDSFPMMPNMSKVNRKALRDLDIKFEQNEQKFDNVTEKDVACIFESILSLPSNSIGKTSKFFEVGGTSLMISQLSGMIANCFKREYPTSLLYQDSSVVGIASEILSSKEYERKHDAIDYKFESDITGYLGEAIPKSKDYSRFSRAKKIFITGATGFLGGALLAEFLKKSKCSIYCLVRSEKISSGLKKLEDNLKKLNLWEQSYQSKINVILGDLSKSKLGIEDSIYEKLTKTIDSVYHIGADISYLKSYEEMKKTNVEACKNIVLFATTSTPKIIHHCSTLAVFGSQTFFLGNTIVNEDTNHIPAIKCIGVESGYSKSKLIAEMVFDNAEKENVCVFRYRPGFITGNTTTNGYVNVQDYLSCYIKGCLQMGIHPDRPNKYWMIVPVDYCASSMYEIGHLKTIESLKLHRKHNSFHLITRREDELSNNKIFDSLNNLGYETRRVPIEEWLEKVKGLMLNGNTDNSLYPLASYSTENLIDGKSVFEVHEDTPYTSIEYTENLVSMKYKVNQDFLQKYMEDLKYNKFL